MESQLTITCPNCGASTSNQKNCEYCGSLLVRLVSQQLNISDDTFSEDGFVFPVIKKALQENLSFQQNKRYTQSVITDLVAENRFGEEAIINIFPSEDLTLGTNIVNPITDIKKGKSVGISIVFLTKSSDPIEAEEERKKLSNFEQLPMSQLFTRKNWEKGCNYYIDFGSDVDSAAKIISKLFLTYKCTPSSSVVYNTAYVDKNSFTYSEATSQQESSTSILTIILIILGIIVSLVCVFL